MAVRKTVVKTTRESYSPLGGSIGSFIGSFFSSIKNAAADGVDTILMTAGDRVIDVQKKMFKNLFITMCIWVAVAFLLLAGGFFMVDYLEWPRYLVFLAVGAALLIIASVRANLRD